MVIRLATGKLKQAHYIVDDAIKKPSLSRVELQSLTGYLNFVSIVVPLGRTFLRRLYNMQTYFPQGSSTYKRRVSSEANQDLRWWRDTLAIIPKR